MDKFELLKRSSFAESLKGGFVMKDEEFGLLEQPPLYEVPIKTGKLTIMIGMPRSGKSTFSRKWCREIPLIDDDGVIFPRVVVCADNIRLAISGERYNSHAEPIVAMIKDYMIKTLLLQGFHILVDGTHTTKSSIKRMLQIDSNADWVYVDTDLETCVQRAKDCGHDDLVPILEGRFWPQLKAMLDEGVSSVFEKARQEVKQQPQHRIQQ